MPIRRSYADLASVAVLGIAVLGAGACGDNIRVPGNDGGKPPGAPDAPDAPDAPAGGAGCAGAGDVGISLPDGFCATVFADQLRGARHLAVTPAGDVFVAIMPAPGTTEPGRVVALRDTDRDGVAEVRQDVVGFGGNGIAWQAGRLFVAADDRIVRFALADGALMPERAEVVVEGLPVGGDHERKSVAVAGDVLYVNRGSATNACQVENRVLHSPGIDPCRELCMRAGVWKFSASGSAQRADCGLRFATGVRNANALALAPDGTLWAAVNGRDQLHDNWPERFTAAQEQELPGEEIVALHQGVDRGWPYCYYDPRRDDMMLAPEYGGDGAATGRCEAIANPEASLPAHWSPLGAVFYEGRGFPERYRGGMFIANHGSRFDPMSIRGYNVVFVPFTGGVPGAWEEFATGFTGGGLPLPGAAAHRPVGVAVMPDGALLISDDQGGRIWKVRFER